MQAQLLSDVAFLRAKGFTRIELKRVKGVLRACAYASNGDVVYFSAGYKHRITSLCAPDTAMFDVSCPANFTQHDGEIISPVVSGCGNFTDLGGSYFVTDEKAYSPKFKRVRNLIPRCLARLPGYRLLDIDDDFGIAFTDGESVCILPLFVNNVRYLKGFKRTGAFFKVTLQEFTMINVDTGSPSQFLFHKAIGFVPNPGMFDENVPAGYGFQERGGRLITITSDPHPISGFVKTDSGYFVDDYRLYLTPLNKLRNLIPRALRRLPDSRLVSIDTNTGITIRSGNGLYVLPLTREQLRGLKHLPRRGIFFMLSPHCAFAT